jgi:hypothetical protein
VREGGFLLTTNFSRLRKLVGLSSLEAAQFLDVSLDTIKSWSSGRNGTPEWAIDDLRLLWSDLERRADIGIQQLYAMIEAQGCPPSKIKFIAPTTDREAQEELDLPFVSAFDTFVAIFMTRTDISVVTIDRSSTTANESLVEGGGVVIFREST